MANKVRYGLEQVHIAFRDDDESGKPSWETPIAIPGAVNFSANPDGGESTFYADNTKYYTRNTNNGYTAELEMALVPDEVLAQLLGWEIDGSGMLVEDAEGVPAEFALMAQVQGDARNRRFVYYRCTASRPTQTHATTTDTTEPTTETLNLTIMPLDVDGRRLVRGVIELDDDNEAVYNGFFDDVVLPAEEGE